MYIYIYIYTPYGSGSSLPCSKHCRLPQVLRHVVAAIARSPTWHRRTRRKRSAARRRIKAARLAGSAVSSKDIRLLEAHHSRPLYREGRMGRRQQWNNEAGWKKQQGYGGWQPSYTGGASYRGQHGEWEGWEPPARGSRYQEDKPRFPSYTAMELDSAPSKAPTGSKEEAALPLRPGDLVRGIQKYVTAARKAEMRTRKATEAREHILARWHKYQEELQATFVQERNNYKKDLLKNQEELDRLQDAQREAFQELKNAFDNPETMMEKPETEPNEEATADWERLLQACEEEDVDMTEAMAEKLGNSLRAFLGDRPPKTPARKKASTKDEGTPPRRQMPGAAPCPAWTSSWKKPLASRDEARVPTRTRAEKGLSTLISLPRPTGRP